MDSEGQLCLPRLKTAQPNSAIELTFLRELVDSDDLVEHHLYVDPISSHAPLLQVLEHVSLEGDESREELLCSAHPSLLFIRTLHRIAMETASIAIEKDLLRGTERWTEDETRINSRIAILKNRRSAQVFLLRLFVELLLETRQYVIHESDAVWCPRLWAALPTLYPSLPDFATIVDSWDVKELADEQALWQTFIAGNNVYSRNILERNKRAFDCVQTWASTEFFSDSLFEAFLTTTLSFLLQLARGSNLPPDAEPPSYNYRHHQGQRPPVGQRFLSLCCDRAYTDITANLDLSTSSRSYLVRSRSKRR